MITRAPKGGVRIRGRFYRGGQALPGEVAQRHRQLGQSARPNDPAIFSESAPPNFGRSVLPHIITFSGLQTTLSRSYRHADEAMRDSVPNAHMMLNDPMITEPLFARIQKVSLYNWHIEPGDPKDPTQQALANRIQSIIERTPYFTLYRFALGMAIWYGRYANENQFASRRETDGRKHWFVNKWTPVSGDKLVFRYDDGRNEFDPEQVGIRVSPALVGSDKLAGERKWEPTADGVAYFLEPWEQKAWCIHKHLRLDGEYEDPLSAGKIHGVGLRSFLYWIWLLKQEAVAQLTEIVERTARGFIIYWYPSGNDKARDEVEKIAREQAHQNVILMPKDPELEQYGIDVVEANTNGITALQDLIKEHYQHLFKRLILGQTLSSEADATGMGSGLADLHLDTLMEIAKFDSRNMEESITRTMVAPIRDYNYPRHRDVDLYFRIDTDTAKPAEELDAAERLHRMGVSMKASEVRDKAGFSKPDPDDEVVGGQQMDMAQQALAGGQFGPESDLSQWIGGDHKSGLEAEIDDALEQGPAEETGTKRQQIFGPIQNWRAPWQPWKYGKSDLRQRLAEAVAQTDVLASDAQREAGNHRKGKFAWNGLRIAIETPKDCQRRSGWEPLAAHYGEILRNESEADGDNVDVFIGPNAESGVVYVVDQLTAGGVFDEHKCLIGFTNKQEAQDAYLGSYPSGWKCGPVTALTIDQFKAWLEDGNTGERIEKQVSKYRKYAKEDWTPYQGPAGGKGWQNVKTGQIVYGTEEPWTEQESSSEDVATPGPAPSKDASALVSKLDTLPEGAEIRGYTRTATAAGNFWVKGDEAITSKQLVDAENDLDVDDDEPDGGGTSLAKPHSPRPSPGNAPRTARDFGYGGGDPHSFAITTARKLGFDAPGGTKEEKAQAAAEFLDDIHDDLKAINAAAQSLGYKPRARLATTNAIHGARHILNAATAKGFQPSGDVTQDLRNAAAMLHGKQQDETSRSTAFGDSAALIVGLVASSMGGRRGGLLAFLLPLMKELSRDRNPSDKGATDALLALSKRLGMKPKLSPPVDAEVLPNEPKAKATDPTKPELPVPEGDLLGEDDGGEQPATEAPYEGPPENPQPRDISSEPKDITAKPENIPAKPDFIPAEPKTIPEPATGPVSKPKPEPRVSNKQRLDQAITEAIGDDPEDLKGFRQLVSEVWDRKRKEAIEADWMRREIIQNFYGGDMAAFTKSMQRAHGDVDKIPRFDQMVEYAQDHYPQVFSLGVLGQGTEEDALLRLFSQGKIEPPAQHSDEVIGEALDIVAAMEAAHAARSQGEDVPFDFEEEERGEDWEGLTEEERSERDPDYVPFSKWSEGMRQRLDRAGQMRQRYEKARSDQDWVLAKIYRAALAQADRECDQYARKRAKSSPGQKSFDWGDEDERKHPRDEHGQWTKKGEGESSAELFDQWMQDPGNEQLGQRYKDALEREKGKPTEQPQQQPKQSDEEPQPLHAGSDNAATGSRALDWMIARAKPMQTVPESLKDGPQDIAESGIFEGRLPHRMRKDLQSFAADNKTHPTRSAGKNGSLYAFEDQHGRSFALTVNWKTGASRLTWDHRFEEATEEQASAAPSDLGSYSQAVKEAADKLGVSHDLVAGYPELIQDGFDNDWTPSEVVQKAKDDFEAELQKSAVSDELETDEWEPSGDSHTFGPKQTEVRQHDDGQWFYNAGDGWVAAGQGMGKRLNQLFGPEDDPEATPREKAQARTETQYDSDYAFARQSDIPNAGEDLLGSARHKANEWRGLEEAEADGTAEQFVTRAMLLKNEPHNLMVKADTNPLTSMAMHLALMKFPPKPGHAKSNSDTETAKKDRRQYVETYRRLKDKAEQLAQKEDNPAEALKRFGEEVGQTIKELRGQDGDGYMAQVTATDKYNNTANGLVGLYNKTRQTYRVKSTHVLADLKKFTGHVSEHYGDLQGSDLADKVIDHAKDVIEGKSVDKAFGVAGKGRGNTFTPADMYVKVAERKGGQQMSFETARRATDYMVSDLGMRGVQWGNSVTDDERQHHASMAAMAFADLTNILGLEQSEASLGGKLGLAIGARGRGSAVAHYEPGTRVINLTRKAGVGSLAHEWGHAFDHEVMDAKPDSYGSEQMRWRARMLKKAEEGQIVGDRKRFDEQYPPYADDREQAMHESYLSLMDGMTEYRQRLGSVISRMKREGRSLFKGREYWESGREMFARCFERYVQRKLEKAGRKNTYLAGFRMEADDASLWPTDDEVDAMEPAFDSLFEAYQSGDR